jgi:hypothetical protein
MRTEFQQALAAASQHQDAAGMIPAIKRAVASEVLRPTHPSP